MFSKELEALINASLEDGILEEYEKAAIVKRAKSEGSHRVGNLHQLYLAETQERARLG